MKKVVLELDLNDDKDKQRAMRKASSLPGVEMLSMDMKTKKLTVVGDVDPVDLVCKLRRRFHATIISVGPAKEPEKKEEPKKSEEKKEEPKKVEGKKEEQKKVEGKKEETKNEGQKKEEPKKEEKKLDPNPQLAEIVNSYRAYNPHMTARYHSMEENPNSCVVC